MLASVATCMRLSLLTGDDDEFAGLDFVASPT